MYGKMKKILITFSALFLFYNVIYAEQNLKKRKFLLHSEVGYYNKGYQPLEYKNSGRSTFGTPMNNTGLEFSFSDKDGNIFGGGIVHTTIKSKTHLNYDVYEYQPFTAITVPYVFAGKNFGWWGFEIGNSWYFTVEKKEKDRSYYNSDGTIDEKISNTTELNRKESHLFINLMLRVLPEDSLHFKLRVGREQFNIVDSLINVAAIYPYKNNIFDMYVSLKAPKQYYKDDDSMIKSNQRIGLNYSYKIDPINLGLSFAYLINNAKGGEGGVSYKNSIRLGFSAGINW